LHDEPADDQVEPIMCRDSGEIGINQDSQEARVIRWIFYFTFTLLHQLSHWKFNDQCLKEKRIQKPLWIPTSERHDAAEAEKIQVKRLADLYKNESGCCTDVELFGRVIVVGVEREFYFGILNDKKVKPKKLVKFYCSEFWTTELKNIRDCHIDVTSEQEKRWTPEVEVWVPLFPRREQEECIDENGKRFIKRY
jgi:hypothetical protein